ncbi:SMI1/KNR4 family protein [Nocardia bovistercoris]|uniref:SMI1/KNR4 family protein n=1 Tax=Nocardia bovistercoris TaxID=2785916 RepID=A0A931IFK2_9NOCA|nr:SMI1/KNR4 family protein [Nocardia bovistercoris]MBH0780524.1 SMI1/KNR4 family protein [Nocardia bovistercoris]
MATPRDALLDLRRAASAGLLDLDGSSPASSEAVQVRETLPAPHFGTVAWSVPPSYRALLAEHNRLCCQRGDDDRMCEFVLVDEGEFVGLNAELVHMPEGVSREPGRYLSTNHLVGFAEAGYEAVWCFDVSQPGEDGEYPVYYHHQDEPRARYLADGAWEEQADSVPDFPSFAAWFEAMAAAFTSEQPPAWLDEMGTPALVWLARDGIFKAAGRN